MRSAYQVMRYYYTFDHLGSVREMTDGSGTIQARYDYDPFGKTTLVSGTDLATFQYAGMMKHQPSGLYLTPADEDGDGGRIYDSAMARFLSRDFDGAELLPEGPNLYSYVGNNPINYIDPNGSDAAAARIISELHTPTIAPELPKKINAEEGF